MTKPMKQGPAFGAGGTALWKQYADAFDLDASDETLLREACNAVDLVDALDADVAANGPLDADGKIRASVTEARFQKGIVLKLLAQLERLSGETGSNLGTRGSYRVRSAS